MSTKTRKKGPTPKRKSGNARPASQRRRAKARSQARRKRRMAGMKTAAAVALGVVALGAIFFLSNSGGSKGTGEAGEYEFVVGNPGVGEKAPPLQLPSTDGGMFDLASERGQSVLLYFQEGIMCQPCWDQLKDIETEFSEFEALGVDKIVTITTDPPDALKLKVADEGLTSEVLADPGVSASREWYRRHRDDGGQHERSQLHPRERGGRNRVARRLRRPAGPHDVPSCVESPRRHACGPRQRCILLAPWW